MKRTLISVLAIAVIVRLGALIALGRIVSPEKWEYDQIALNLIHGKGYLAQWLNTDYRSFCYPVYPMLTAASHLLTGCNYFVLELLHIAVSVLTCYLVYRIALKLFDEKTALLAGLLTALHPGLVVYSTKLHELTFVAFYIVFVIWYIVYRFSCRLTGEIGLGVLLGVGVLTRPTLIFFLPAVAVYMALSGMKIRAMARSLTVITLVVVLMILPWTVRNYAVHKRWIFITSNSPEHFWRGNNPQASGTSYTAAGVPVVDAAPEKFKEKLLGLDEMGQYDYFTSEASRFVRADPVFFLKISLRKLCYFWWFAPQTGLLYPAAWLVVYKFYYFVIALFFMYGATCAIRQADRPRMAVCAAVLAFMLIVSIVHAMYYVEIRHRWAVEPLMLLFAAYGAVRLFTCNKTGGCHVT